MSARKPKPAGYNQMRRKNEADKKSVQHLPTMSQWQDAQQEPGEIIITQLPGDLLSYKHCLSVPRMSELAHDIKESVKKGHKLLLILGSENIIQRQEIEKINAIQPEPDVREALSSAERYASSANARMLAAVLRSYKVNCKIFDGSESEDYAALINPLLGTWPEPSVVIIAGAGDRAQSWAVESANLLDQTTVIFFTKNRGLLDNNQQVIGQISIDNLLRTENYGGLSHDALEQALFDEITIKVLPGNQVHILQDLNIGSTITPK